MCLDKARFTQQPIHHDLTCSICLGVLCINSVVDPTEHAFCKVCIMKWLDGGNHKCPIGNEKITPDFLKPICRIVKNVLSDHKVTCKFSDKGCNQVFSYENYIVHENSCTFNPRKNTSRNRDKNKALILNSSKIICYKTIRIPKCTFGRMALFNNNTEIISADGINNRLNICDINGNLINSFNPDGILQQPMSICVNDTDCENIEIYVGDYVTHKIIVFNSNFKYLGEFGNETLNVPEFIAIDKENFENLIYISDYRSNSITVWNSKRCEMTDVVEIDSPYTIKVFDEKLFVVSPAQFEVLDNSDKNSLKFKKITKGNNCVFILDKKSLRILDTIKLDNWLNPSSLHIDSKLNIYTVAYEINKPSGLLSKFKSLYIVDKNGILVKKFELEDIQITADMIVLDSELIFSVNNEIKIIQFK